VPALNYKKRIPLKSLFFHLVSDATHTRYTDKANTTHSQTHTQTQTRPYYTPYHFSKLNSARQNLYFSPTF
jgi:hypothetical protein